MASEPGRARVSWILEHRSQWSSGGGYISLPESFVEIADGAGEQRIELALTSEELAAGLRAR